MIPLPRQEIEERGDQKLFWCIASVSGGTEECFINKKRIEVKIRALKDTIM
ncbi:hypothetical protein Hanom_Chr16g01453011 [Helianthus anomalus]